MRGKQVIAVTAGLIMAGEKRFFSKYIAMESAWQGKAKGRRMVLSLGVWLRFFSRAF